MYNFVTSKKLFYFCQIKIIWQIFRQKKIKINKMSTKKVKNYVPCSPTAFPWTKKSTKFFSQSPPTRFPPSTHTHTHTHKHTHTHTHTHKHTHTHTNTHTHTHTNKHTYSLPESPQSRNCSYAAAQGIWNFVTNNIRYKLNESL